MLVGVVLLATAAYTGISLLVGDPATHSVVDRVWLNVSGASETRSLVNAAHHDYNRLVWGDGPPSLRVEACESMREASDMAEEEHGPDVAREVAAVAAQVCDHATEAPPDRRGSYLLDLEVHDVLDGHEFWLRANAE